MIRTFGNAISAGRRRKPGRAVACLQTTYSAYEDLASCSDRHSLRGARRGTTKEIGEYDVAAGIQLYHKGSLASQAPSRRGQVSAGSDGKIGRPCRTGHIGVAGGINRKCVSKI